MRYSDYPSQFYITHRCFLLMAYITVFDGAVNTIHIHIVLFYEKPRILWVIIFWRILQRRCTPDSKVHGANMGTTWVLSAPVGPHVGPMNLAIWDHLPRQVISQRVVCVFYPRKVGSQLILLSCIVTMMCAFRFYVTGIEIGRKGTVCVFVIEFKGIKFRRVFYLKCT